MDGMCSTFCGFHSHATINGKDIKYAYAGRAAGCPACQPSVGPGPNSPLADAAINVIAHEVDETVTDPDLNAWFDSGGEENADLCAWQFGTVFNVGGFANTRIGSRNYLIQQNLVNRGGGYCSVKQRASGDLTGDDSTVMASAFTTDIALVGGSGWTTIPIARSNGDGSWNVFNATQAWFAGTAAAAGAKPVSGDFNGDGRGDIALVGGSGWNTVPVAFSNGDGTFTTTNFPVTDFPSYAQTAGAKPVAGDFNGDGFADIALTGGSGWNTIPVAIGLSDGHFLTKNFTVANFPSHAQVAGAKPVAGDFNGDGFADIALTGGSGWNTIPVAFGTGDGHFTTTNLNVASFPGLATGAGVTPVAGDFDGDGRGDIALTGGSGWNTIPLAVSTGGGNFTFLNISVDNGFGSLASTAGVKIVAGDFDADGRGDIALTGVSGWNTIPVAFSRFGSFGAVFNSTNLGGAGAFHTLAPTANAKAVGGY
jgi:hypothetical protein